MCHTFDPYDGWIVCQKINLRQILSQPETSSPLSKSAWCRTHMESFWSLTVCQKRSCVSLGEGYWSCIFGVFRWGKTLPCFVQDLSEYEPGSRMEELPYLYCVNIERPWVGEKGIIGVCQKWKIIILIIPNIILFKRMNFFLYLSYGLDNYLSDKLKQGFWGLFSIQKLGRGQRVCLERIRMSGRFKGYIS